MAKARQSRERQTPLRVVFFLDNLDVGGTELSTLRTARYLDPSRVHLRVVALRADGPLRAEFEAMGADVVELPVRGLAHPGTLSVAWALFRLLRAWRADIFHTFDPYTNILGVPVARAAGIRRVVASHRWWDGVHGSGLERVNAIVVRLAHCLVANSARVGALAAAKGMPPGRVAIVPNFVEPELQSGADPDWVEGQRQGLGVPDGAVVVGCVARLARLKGHATLLEAVASHEALAGVHVILVGDGPERGALEELARTLEIEERVHLAGRRPNVPNPNHLFDISVLCSTMEAFPISILEAMAAGKPVVATRVGGIPDAVREGVTGFLVPVHDARELSNRLADLAHDPRLRRRLGDAGRRRIDAEFLPGAAMASLIDVYGHSGDEPGLARRAETLPRRGWSERPAQATPVAAGLEPVASPPGWSER